MSTDFWTSIIEQIINRFKENLPALITVFLFALIGWILSILVSKLMKRLITQIGLNQIYEKSRLALEMDKFKPGRSLADLVGKVTFWLLWLYITFAGIAASGLNLEKSVLLNIMNFMPRLFTAFLILVGGVMLAQLVGRWVQISIAATGVEYAEILGKGSRLILITIVVISAVNELGINLSPFTNALTNIITIIVGGLALAFGLGARDVVNNILAGYYAREYFEIGEIIEIGDVSGTLNSIGTVSAEIDFEGNRLVVSNSELNRKTIKLNQ